MLDPISMFPIIINHLPPLSEYNGIVAPPLPFHTSSLYFRALASSPVHGPCLFGAGGILFGVGAAAAAARRTARRMATLLIGLFPCRLRSCLTISRRYMYFFFFYDLTRRSILDGLCMWWLFILCDSCCMLEECCLIGCPLCGDERVLR